MKYNGQKIILLGAGGHAQVLLDCLRWQKKLSVVAILESNQSKCGLDFHGVPILLESEEILKKYSPHEVKVANAIGSVRLPTIREQAYIIKKRLHYHFLTVIHPTAYVGFNVSIGEGTQLMAGCTIQPGAIIGDNVLINTHAVVDHDCQIQDHVHLAPGVVCCGNVTIGKGTHVGTGACIVQGVIIGERCLIAAGAVVTQHIQNNSKVAGVPAKLME